MSGHNDGNDGKRQRSQDGTDTGTVSDVQPGWHKSTSLNQVLLFCPIGASVWKGILSAPPEQLSWPKELMQ